MLREIANMQDEIERVQSILARLETVEDPHAIPGLVSEYAEASSLLLICAGMAMATERCAAVVAAGGPQFHADYRAWDVDADGRDLLELLLDAPLTWGVLAQPCREHWGRAKGLALALAEDTEPGAFALTYEAREAWVRLGVNVELDLYTQLAPPLSASNVLWLWVGARLGTDTEPTCLLHGPVYQPDGLEDYRQAAPGADVERMVRLSPGDVRARAEVEDVR